MDLGSRLKHIEHVKSFGEGLGIDFKDILSRYDSTTKHQNLYYLIVTPPNSLEAHVEEEVIGKSRKKLVKLEREYRELGYDTMLDKAVGWDSGQITKSLLKRNYIMITGTVLHEGWHNTSRLDNSSLNLEEAIAGVIESLGVIEYYKVYDKKKLEKARFKHQESCQISDYVMKYYRRLRKAYKESDWIELKPRILDEAKEERKVFMANCVAHASNELVSVSKINNSFFYFQHIYYQHFRLVDKLAKKLGLEESIKFFRRYEDHKNCIKNMREMTGGA